LFGLGGLLKNLGQHDNQLDLALQQPTRNVRYEETKIALNLRRYAFVLCVDVQKRSIRFGKPDARKNAVKHTPAYDCRHERLDA
jgi:hypothetical protein